MSPPDSPVQLDLERLLAPVTPGEPAGADVSTDPSPVSPFNTLKRLHQKLRNRERDFGTESEEAREKREPIKGEWEKLALGTQELIVGHCKHLELGAWLVEAEIRLHEFAGLRDGLRFLRQLIERFWEELYPRPEEAALDDQRLKPIRRLLTAEQPLVSRIRLIPLTTAGDEGPVTLTDYKNAELAAARQQQTETESEGSPTQRLQSAGAQTDESFFLTLQADLLGCQDELLRLSDALASRWGAGIVPVRAVEQELSAAMSALRFLAGGKLPETEPAEMNPADTDTEASADVAISERSAHPEPRRRVSPSSRDEAFESILQLATYFRRAEPHSPISYLLEQTVRWGRMPLPELWQELVADEEVRNSLFQRTGVRPPAE